MVNISIVPSLGTTMRACKTCGNEKPLTDFGLNRCYHKNTCRCCVSQHRKERYIEQRTRNLELYGFATDPEQRDKDRVRVATKRTANKELYGSVQSPKEQERTNLHAQQNYKTNRQNIILLYGDRCACCGETGSKLLTIDHVNGNGKKSGIVGIYLIRALSKDLQSTGHINNDYRVLCWNCNLALGLFGYCPHNGIPVDTIPTKANYKTNNAEYARWRKRMYKLELINIYGGKCNLCGDTHPEFLTIDHINGNGGQHRRELGYTGGANFYAWLRRQGYPRGDYQLLCFNCNYAKGG